MKGKLKRLLSVLLAVCLMAAGAPVGTDTALAAVTVHVEDEAALRSVIDGVYTGYEICIVQNITLTSPLTIDQDVTLTSENASTLAAGTNKITIADIAEGAGVIFNGDLNVEGIGNVIIVEGTFTLGGDACVKDLGGTGAPVSVPPDKSGEINITGGSITGGQYGVGLSGNSATVTVSGGEINGTHTGVRIRGENNSADISGGSITGQYAVDVGGTGGTAAISGGSIAGTVYAVYASGTAEITGGSFSGKVSTGTNGTLNITSGDVTLGGGTPGVYYYDSGQLRAFLTVLPGPASAEVSQEFSIPLTGVFSAVDYAIDPATDASLSATVDNVADTVTMNPTAAGSYRLVLTAGVSSQTFNLTVPVTVTADELEVTGIAVKTQPGDLVYTAGENLDLSGLEVTLTYNDSSTEDAALADFAAKGITADPADGTSLTVEAHHGNPVVLTCNGHDVSTGNLTVTEEPAENSIISVAAGGGFSLFLEEDGTPWSWGGNMYGQLGDGTNGDWHYKDTPHQVPGLSGIVQLQAGHLYSLALKDDGTVWVWGTNGNGQLCQDSSVSLSNVPVQVSGLTNITAIAAGDRHCLVLKNDGTVWGWGYNSYGQLGNGSTIEAQRSPVQVSGLSGVVAVTAGYWHSLALKSDGTVWAWGNNTSGQLGNNSTTNSSTPVQVGSLSQVDEIYAAGFNSAAIIDGEVWAWGGWGDGQLGPDASEASSKIPQQLAGLSDITNLGGAGSFFIALKDDGTVWSWGRNDLGQLGIGTTSTNVSNPTQIAGLSNIIAISDGTGGDHSLALEEDGTAWAWGTNNSGALGNDTSGSGAGSNVPVMVLFPGTVPPDPVCEIVGGDQYETLGEALAAVGADETKTIKLLQDIDYSGGIEIEGKNITFDLDGFDLIVTNGSGKGLIVTDGTVGLSGTGEFNVTGTDGVQAYNSTVTVTNATATGDGRGAWANTGSSVTVNGNVTANGDGGKGSEAVNGGRITITGNSGGKAAGAHASGAGSEITIDGDASSTEMSGFGAMADTGGSVTLNNVTAAGANSYGARAINGTVTINGNAQGVEGGVWAMNTAVIIVGGDVSGTGGGSYGAKSDTGGQITVDGVITGENYIKVGTITKSAADKKEPTTKEGYYTYTDNTSTVWVKAVSVNFNDEDAEILTAFANQPGNLAKLQKGDPTKWDLSDPSTWTDVEWEEVNGELRVTGIGFQNLAFPGGLDVSGLTELKTLNCYGNDFNWLDISGTALTALSCAGNPDLELIWGLDALLSDLGIFDFSGCLFSDAGDYLDAEQDVLDLIAMIDALPAVGNLILDDADEVAAARTSFDALTDVQELFVSNLAALNAAEARILELQAGEPVPVTSITVTAAGNATSVKKGKTLQMSAAVTPANATDKTVTWSVEKGDGDATISATGLLTATAVGTVTVKATANDGSSIVGQKEITVTAASSGGGGGGGGGLSTPDPMTINATVTGDIVETKIPVNVNTATGSGTVSVNPLLADQLFSGNGAALITVPPISEIDAYTMQIPASLLSGSDGGEVLTFSTENGSITIPGNMISGLGIEGLAGITIDRGDKSLLPEDVQAALGDRPLVQLRLTVNGQQREWSNPGAPVTVSIPYTPTATELVDPEHIVVWYIDGAGNVQSVPNGRYDPAAGRVTFTTTHFSLYAVAYVHKTFNDIDAHGWAKKQIEALASKGIISGTSENTFSPEANITRGDYLVLLVKTLGLNAVPDSNFDDVNQGDYYYAAIGIAKKLGIAAGSADNKFNPRESISRQDMMVLTARALEKSKNLVVAGTSGLNAFSDTSDIAEYAAESIAALVGENLVAGSDGKLYPRANTSRAEAVVILYRIYNK